MGAIMLVIFIICAFGSGIRNSFREDKLRYNSDGPTWMDSHGVTRLKSNGKKVSMSWKNAEGHYIIEDKKGNQIDNNWELMKLMLDHDGVILEYGESDHRDDKVRGRRFVEKIGDEYVFYSITTINTMDFYTDVNTGKLVKPTKFELKVNKKCGEIDPDRYMTNDDYISVMNKYNQLVDHIVDDMGLSVSIVDKSFARENRIECIKWSLPEQKLNPEHVELIAKNRIRHRRKFV